MIFAGHYEHTIDAKNRLAIPARFRSRLDPERDGAGFYVSPGQPPTTLWLYTERHFERLAQRPQSALIPDDDQLRFEQVFFPWAELVELDSQGRILVPEKMLRRSGLDREVVICGVRDHLEIRSRKQFDSEADASWEHYREYQLRARAAYAETERQSGQSAGNS